MVQVLWKPALTKVSVKIGAESLPFFYGVNKFHLEMSSFRDVSTRESVTAWWRAIGDTNLRMIRRLNIVSHPPMPIANPDVDENVMMRYRRLTQKGDVRLTKGTYHGQLVGILNDVLATSLKSKVPKLMRILDVIADDGLHVRALEQMIALLEPFGVLRDYAALGNPQY